MIPKKQVQGAPFTVLIGREGMSTYTFQTMTGSNGNSVGLFNSSRVREQTITVSDNDFTSGSVLLYLGDFKVISGLDYVVGATAGDTATNLAGALNALPGITASADGIVVTAILPLIIGEEQFRAEYLGTIQNFTLDPSNGFTGVSAVPVDAPTF